MNIIPRDSFFDFDRLFNHFSTPAARTDFDSRFFSPKVDITDHKDRYEISAEMAGVDKDNLSVDLEDGLLTIRATIENESSEEKEGKVIRKERHSGSFLRSFQVGPEVKESDISANFKNGLLTLSVPKTEDVAAERKRIEIL